MLELRPNCECCNKDLPPEEALTPAEKERLAGAGRSFRPALEVLEGHSEFAVLPEMMDEPVGILECNRSALAGMRAGRMRGVPDQERPAPRPRRQGGDIERCCDDDLLHGVDDLRDRIVPTGVEAADVLLEGVLLLEQSV